MFKKYREFTDIVIIVFCWIIMILFIKPIGDFPINDDWAFYKIIKNFLDHGSLKILDFLQMTLIFQLLYGIVITFFFGCSFTVLRFSTLLLGLTGGIYFYFIMKRLRINPFSRLLSTLLLVFNPMYVNLSNSFMTDIPFISLSLIATYYYINYIQKKTYDNKGILFISLATFIRQPGIIIPFAFFIIKLLENRRDLKKIQLPLIHFSILLAVLLLYPWILKNTIGFYDFYNASSKKLLHVVLHSKPKIIITNIVFYFAIFNMYIGLFVFPLNLLKIKEFVLLLKKKRYLIFAGSAFLYLLLIQIKLNRLMPVSGNLLNYYGVGPVILRDLYVLNLNHLPSFNLSFLKLITGVSVFSGMMTMTFFMKIGYSFFRKDSEINCIKQINLFLLLISVFSIAPFFILGFYDRYLLTVLPFLMIMLLYNKNFEKAPFINKIALAVIILFVSFSVLANHDFFALNKVRWRVLNDLTTNKKIRPEEIDGGYEFNGLYLYHYPKRAKKDKSWWWVEDDKYVVSIGDIKGYEVVGEYKYKKYLPVGSKGKISLLKRTG